MSLSRFSLSRGSAVISAFGMIAAACAEGSTTLGQAADKAADAGTWMPTSFTCTPSQPQAGAPLSLIPAGPPEGPGVAIFRQVDAECDWHEPAQVVLYNGSATDVEISALGLDEPHLAVEPIALPYTLAAGDILPLQLLFKTELGSFNAKLSVASSAGCAQFPVRAKGVEAGKVGVMIHDPYVVNFGHVAAGAESQAIELTVLDQPMNGSAQVKVGNFQSSSPSFRIEPQTKSSTAGACEPSKVTLRMLAPNTPGVLRGQLSWTFEAQQNTALTLTEMIGVVD